MNHKTSKMSIFKNLSAAYIDDYPSVADLYDLSFNKDEHIVKRVSYLDTKNFERDKLCDALLEINKRYCAKQSAIDNIEKLRRTSTLAVVTGQQAGIFTGPSYTVFKAITTIKLAKKYSYDLNRDVVPVFWIASEDHDFEEIRSVSYIEDDKVKKIKIDKKPGSGNNNPFKDKYNFFELKESIKYIDINTSLKAAIDEYIRECSKDGEETLIKLLTSTLKDTETISDWFGRIMVMLLSEYGLIILDPMEKSIREIQSGFFTTSIIENEKVKQNFCDKTELLISKGYSPLISLEERATGVFTYYAGERLMIKTDDKGYFIDGRDEQVRFSEEQLVEMTKHNPACFSTNVILRPVVQDVTLPTIAYVAGPGELSYYGQLGSVYNVYNMEMPIIYPRENFTVITKEVGSSLNKLQIDVEEVIIHGIDSVKKSILEKNDEIRIDYLFEEFNLKFNKEYDELLDKLSTISPEIEDISKKNKGLILSQLDYLQEKAHRFHRKNNRPALNDLKLIETCIAPKGSLQEREIPFIQFMINTDQDIIKYIIEDIPMDYKHRFIRL